MHKAEFHISNRYMCVASLKVTHFISHDIFYSLSFHGPQLGSFQAGAGNGS